MEFIPYFLVFSLVAAIGVGETSNKKTFDKHATVFLLLVPLVALATFRPVGVGSDDLAYVDIFFRIPSILDCQLTFCGYDYSEIQVEPGFFGLLSILRVFGKNTTLLFLTISTLAVLLNLKAISFFAQNY